MTPWRNTAFVYDAHGNMIADTTKGTTYSYDAFNQLDTVSLATMFDSTPYIAFGYAPSGERVYKKYYYWYKASCGGVTMALGDPMTTTGVGGSGGGISIDSCLFADTSKLYYVIGNGMTLAEYENPKYANSLKAKYIYAGEKRIAMVDNTGQVFYYLNDHLGSTRAVVSKVGDAVILPDRYIYNSYGSDWVIETATNQAYKYTGKPFDDDGGFDLYCYGARYYDPDLGRFISVVRSSEPTQRGVRMYFVQTTRYAL